MAVISKGSLVLVTGASGFIAASVISLSGIFRMLIPYRHIVRELLRAGFMVRGTVRSPSKGEYLMKLFADEGSFEYSIVADMGQVSRSPAPRDMM
jgi:nucleoside-diphosphate-sugar epimerase